MNHDSNSPGDNWDEIFSAPPTSSPPVPPGSGGEQVVQPPGSRRDARRAEQRVPVTPGRPGGGKPPRQPRRKGWIIALAVVVVFLGSAAGGAAWVWSNYEDQVRKVMGWEIPIDYEGDGHGEASITVRQGEGGSVIAASLAEAGVTKTAKAFYQLLLVQDPQVVFYPGHYTLKLEMSAQAALDALQDPANKVEASVLIKEGWNLNQTIAALAEGTGIAEADFRSAVADPTTYGAPSTVRDLEGYLFPARYSFEPDADASSIVNTLVARTYRSLDAAGVSADDRHRVLTIGSMIQREAGSNPDNFYKVSRVIQNRLDSGMKLQFDSTVHFGYMWAHGEREKGSVFSSSEELSDDNPYNTYVHTGLPPGPIGASGDLAIKSALQPADGTWLFFVTTNLDTGETTFTSSLAEHNKAVKVLQKWCRDTQSPNCG